MRKIKSCFNLLNNLQQMKNIITLRFWRNLLVMPTLLAAAGIVNSQGLSVGESGHASLNFPIEVPPSRAGMEPKLSLSYNSSAINGPAGVGWVIQGLSQITRCTAINSLDGRNVASYLPSDKLCLDGQRLIQVNQATASSAGTPLTSQINDASAAVVKREYRTESDSFNKIIAGGSVSGAPMYFKVWSKSGTITEYGALEADQALTSNARITTAGNQSGVTAISAWLVKRISDTAGNFIEFEYAQDGTAAGSGVNGTAVEGREWALKHVRYNKSASNNSVVNEIEFVYNKDIAGGSGFDVYPRADASEAYHAGSKVIQARLLRKVLVRNAGALVREYRINHQSSPSTGRALVKSIEQCSMAGVCLPATEYVYEAGQDGYTKNSVLGIQVADVSGSDRGVLVGDFNGDGRSDLLRWHQDPLQNRIFIASDKSLGSFSQLSSGFDLNTIGDKLGGSPNIRSFVADVNGDAIPDVLRVCKTATDCPSLTIWFGRGDGSFLKVAPNFNNTYIDLWGVPSLVYQCEQISGSFKGNKQTGSTTLFRDFDGDGRLDIVQFDRNVTTGLCPWPAGDSSRALFAKGDGKGGFVTQWLNMADWTDIPFGETVTRGTSDPDLTDVNGDALADYLGSRIRLNNVAGFNSSVSSGIPTRQLRVLLDINADGKVDVITSKDTDGSKDRSPQLFINRGDGTFFLDNRAISPLSADLNFRFGSGAVGSITADVNGDGLVDFIAWDSNGNPVVWLGRRMAGASMLNTFEKAVLNPSRGLPNMSNLMWMGDFLGVGDTSLLVVEGSSLSLYSSGAARPVDLLSSVVSSTGMTSAVSYQTLSGTSASPIYSVGRTIRQDPREFNPDVDLIDVAAPMWVVSSSRQPNGITQSGVIESAFSYFGMKASKERGLLGLSATSKFFPYANGKVLVSTAEYHVDANQHQYAGLKKYEATYVGDAAYTVSTVRTKYTCSAALQKMGECDNEPGLPPSYTTITTRTFNPVLSMSNLTLVSRTDYAYCDLTSSVADARTRGQSLTPPTVLNTYGPPCPSTERVRRPYQAQSVERNFDLKGTPSQPILISQTVTTNREMSIFSEVLSSEVVTSAPDVAGKSDWLSRRLSTNKYEQNNFDKWFLGRLTESSVVSSVNASQPTKTAGTASTAVSGGPATPLPPNPLAPGVLSAILQLLLED